MPTETTPVPALLLTVEEAAAAVRLNKTALYAAMAAGELAYVRLGKHRRIRPRDLEAYAEARLVAAQRPVLRLGKGRRTA